MTLDEYQMKKSDWENQDTFIVGSCPIDPRENDFKRFNYVPFTPQESGAALNFLKTQDFISLGAFGCASKAILDNGQTYIQIPQTGFGAYFKFDFNIG